MSELKRIHVVVITAGILAGSIIGAYEDRDDAIEVHERYRSHSGDEDPMIITSVLFPPGNRATNRDPNRRA